MAQLSAQVGLCHISSRIRSSAVGACGLTRSNTIRSASIGACGVVAKIQSSAVGACGLTRSNTIRSASIGTTYVALQFRSASIGDSFYGPSTIRRTFALTQAQNLNTRNAITRRATQQQAAAVSEGRAMSRTFAVTQGQGLSSQRAITVYIGAGQTVAVMFGSGAAQRTFRTWQVQDAEVSGVIIPGKRTVTRSFAVAQGQGVAMSGRQVKTRTVAVGQGQAQAVLGRTVDSITFALGQASVVIIGFGARFFQLTQVATPTLQRSVVRTFEVEQGMTARVHLPVHRGRIAVTGTDASLAVSTRSGGAAVASRAGRITVEAT